jgi:antitoxin HigA-1
MSMQLHPSLVVHPGKWLRSEIVEPHGLTVTETGATLHARGRR